MINLLIAEDDKVIRKIIEKAASTLDYNVLIVKDGNEAQDILNREEIDIAVLDWMLPGMEGIDLCRMIRSRENSTYTYIILLTSKIDQDDLIEGFSAGADDYVRKPFNSHELIARIKTGKRIIDLQNQLLVTQEQLRLQATHDGLTGLLNRNSILDILETEFERSTRSGSPLGMIMADIDHFKKINDTYGHQAGDEVLKSVASLLKGVVRNYDRVGRYGGEEFIILLPDCNKNTLERIADRLKGRITSEKYLVNGKNLNITISMGISVSGGEEIRSPEAMILRSDNALYKAKRDGRNRWIFAEGIDLVLTGASTDSSPESIPETVN